jgi:hypothetical protein
MSDKITVDMDALTLGDLEELDDLAGGGAMASIQKGAISGKLLTALVFVSQRKTDPAFTLDQARALPLSAFEVTSDNSPKAGQ